MLQTSGWMTLVGRPYQHSDAGPRRQPKAPRIRRSRYDGGPHRRDGGGGLLATGTDFTIDTPVTAKGAADVFQLSSK